VTKKLFPLKALAVAALLLSTTAARADIKAYTDEAAFMAAISHPGVDTYDDLKVRPYDAAMFRIAGDYHYTATAGPNSVLYGAGGIGGDYWLSTDDYRDSIKFSNFSSDVIGMGANFFGSDAFGRAIPNATMLLTANDGTLLQYTLSMSGPSSFLGFVSSTGLASVVLTTDGTTNLWVTANNLTLGVLPVPEPSTYGMFAAGIALLGYVARRRRT
jgi:hypothetical protein